MGLKEVVADEHALTIIADQGWTATTKTSSAAQPAEISHNAVQPATAAEATKTGSVALPAEISSSEPQPTKTMQQRMNRLQNLMRKYAQQC